MILLVVAALVGGILSAVLLWPYGWVITLIAAPFGGSCCAALAAVYLAIRRSPEPAPVVEVA